MNQSGNSFGNHPGGPIASCHHATDMADSEADRIMALHGMGVTRNAIPLRYTFHAPEGVRKNNSDSDHDGCFAAFQLARIPASSSMSFDSSLPQHPQGLSATSDLQTHQSLGQVLDWDTLFHNQNMGTSNTVQNQPQPTTFEKDAISVSCSAACVSCCPGQCCDTVQGVCCDGDACDSPDHCVDDTCNSSDLCVDACNSPGLCLDDACDSPDLCLDEHCQEATHPCMDENCEAATPPEQTHQPAVITDGDKAAAEALASLDGVGWPGQMSSMGGMDAMSAMGGMNYNSTSQALFPQNNNESAGLCFPPTIACANLSPNYIYADPFNFPAPSYQTLPEVRLASHIMQYHFTGGQIQEHGSCIANHPNQLITQCNLPVVPENSLGTQEQPAQQCGFAVHDPAAFAEHVWKDHGCFAPQAFQLDAGSAPLTHNDNSIHPYANIVTAGPELDTSRRPSTSSLQSTFESRAASQVATGLMTSSSSNTPQNLDFFDFGGAPAKQGGLLVCQWVNHDTGAVCGEAFNHEEGLQMHCESKHIRPLKKFSSGFLCGWKGCERLETFPQKNKLERHLQTHTQYKPFACEVCGERFSAKQALRQHVSAHNGEKPWACSWPGCQSKFAQQSALTMHYRTHTGEKPLKCEICGKAFGESSNLAKHRRIHNEKRMYDCEICKKDFNRIDQVRRHLKSNHPERIGEIEEILQRAREQVAKTTAHAKHGRRGRGMKRSSSVATSTSTSTGPMC